MTRNNSPQQRRQSRRSLGREQPPKYRDSESPNDDDPDKTWEFNDILGDKMEPDGTKCYKLQWTPDKTTGEEYEPTWEPAGNIPRAAVNDYEMNKALNAKTASTRSSSTIYAKGDERWDAKKSGGNQLRLQTNSSQDQSKSEVSGAVDMPGPHPFSQVFQTSGGRRADNPIPEVNAPASSIFPDHREPQAIPGDSDDEKISDSSQTVRSVGSKRQESKMGQSQNEAAPGPPEAVKSGLDPQYLQAIANASLNVSDALIDQHSPGTPDKYRRRAIEWMEKPDREKIEKQLERHILHGDFTKETLIIFPEETDPWRRYEPFELVRTVRDFGFDGKRCVSTSDYDSQPNMNHEKEIIIQLRNNPHFRWSHGNTLEYGQLHLRGLDVLGYFSCAVNQDGRPGAVIPHAGVLFGLVCDALSCTGSKIVYCVPRLELVEMKQESDVGCGEGSGNGGTEAVTMAGGHEGTEAVIIVGGHEGTADRVRGGGEGDIIEKGNNTRAHGRHGGTRKRVANSRKRKGKQPMRASCDGDGGDEMELDG